MLVRLKVIHVVQQHQTKCHSERLGAHEMDTLVSISWAGAGAPGYSEGAMRQVGSESRNLFSAENDSRFFAALHFAQNDKLLLLWFSSAL